MSSEAPELSGDERLSPTVCYLCRQRKTKCDRRLPRCSFCTKAKVTCQYVERPKKRGLRAGYVSELESRIELLEQEVQELKNEGSTVEVSAPSTTSLLSPTGHPTHTPSQAQLTPATRDIIQLKDSSNVGSVVDDLTSFPRSYFHHLVDSWFKETQMWVPILNRTRIDSCLEALPTPVDHIVDIELRAVCALTISYSTQAICLGYAGRRRLTEHLRSQVLVEAMSKPSMSSLRALLIIAILDYGSDEIQSTFSLLAICRRMCENIGMFRQLLKRIEAESPAQVGPPAVEMPTGDDAIPLTWCILALDAVSTLGVSWRDVSAALVDHLSSVAFISYPDFRDSFRTHTHLAAIGLQPVQEFLFAQARDISTEENVLGTCDEMYRNLMSYVDGLPETSYTILADGVIDFDICQIFTRLLVHATVIIIYQRFVFDGPEDVAQVARQRCMASCEVFINTMRSISDADAEINNSPVVATFAFVVARFKLVLYRTLGQPREPLFDILMHGINMLGRRWQLARRLDIVLRAAIIEVDLAASTAVSTLAVVPVEFWDLNKSHLDISEILKTWVVQHGPSMYLGNLDGPYV